MRQAPLCSTQPGASENLGKPRAQDKSPGAHCWKSPPETGDPNSYSMPPLLSPYIQPRTLFRRAKKEIALENKSTNQELSLGPSLRMLMGEGRGNTSSMGPRSL